MGIENREYYRESYRGSGGGWSSSSLTPVCKNLLIANVVVYILQLLIVRTPTQQDIQNQIDVLKRDNPAATTEELLQFVKPQPQSVVQNWFQLETSKVLRGQVWRVLTCAFCHDRLSVWHIVINMYLLYRFGATLESMYGSKEFLLFYLTAAVASSAAFIALDLAVGRSIPAIGASGAVWAVMVLYAIFYPRHTILLMFVIPIEIRWIVVIYGIFDLHPVLLELSGQPYHDGIAHAAHLGGLLFGLAYWKFNWRLERIWDGLRLPRFDRVAGPRRNIRIFEPSRDRKRETFDVQLDAILRKIHEQGEENLTDKEREVLIAASERYKNRKGD